jgi:hypothetical protein
MNIDEIVSELEEIVKSLGLTVRYEKGDFRGGDCILRDQNLVVMNKKTSSQQRISLLSRVVGLYGGEDQFIKPLIRQIVDEEMTKYKEELRQYQIEDMRDTDEDTYIERSES